MNHVELHFHYLRQFLHEKVVTLVYCMRDDQIINILMKPLSEANFINSHTFLGLQETTIMGGVQK